MSNFDDFGQMRSAERLFDAIGMIDDKMIADASEAYTKAPVRKSVNFFKRYAVSLTAALLVVTLIGGFVVSNVSDNVANDDFIGNSEDAAENELVNYNTLDVILSSSTSNTTMLSLDEIDFFDGEVSLIWNVAGEDEYHKLTFEATNAETAIKNCMSNSVQQIPSENADSNICMVWVSYGNGEVVSPYLKESAGNVGYATLFDYSPEVVPSNSFCDLVNDALTG